MDIEKEAKPETQSIRNGMTTENRESHEKRHDKKRGNIKQT